MRSRYVTSAWCSSKTVAVAPRGESDVDRLAERIAEPLPVCGPQTQLRLANGSVGPLQSFTFDARPPAFSLDQPLADQR